MNWIHYLNEGTLAGRLARLEKRNSQMARRLGRSGRVTTKVLQDDLGRMALLLRSVTELCLEQGVFGEAELARKLEQVDIADGVSDGRLDPDVVMPGEQKLADLEPLPHVSKKKKRRKRR